MKSCLSPDVVIKSFSPSVISLAWITEENKKKTELLRQRKEIISVEMQMNRLSFQPEIHRKFRELSSFFREEENTKVSPTI